MVGLLINFDESLPCGLWNAGSILAICMIIMKVAIKYQQMQTFRQRTHYFVCFHFQDATFFLHLQAMNVT